MELSAEAEDVMSRRRLKKAHGFQCTGHQALTTSKCNTYVPHENITMRFRTGLRNIQTFTSKSLALFAPVALTRSEFIASLSFIGKVAWIRLDDDDVRFTIIPETGSQVWALVWTQRCPKHY